MFNNGFGAATFPQRFNAPNSQQVMSDGEFEADWNSKLSAVPQTISTPGAKLSFDPSQYAGMTNSVADLNNFYQDNFGRDVGQVGKDFWGDFDRSGSSLAQTIAENALGSDMDYFNNRRGPSVSSVNPAYTQMKNEMDAAMQGREESQIAQQQAYDGMSDQYQKNGIIGAGYTDPNFGVIDGLAPGDDENPLWTAGLTGEDAQTGIYDPLASTEKTFWGL